VGRILCGVLGVLCASAATYVIAADSTPTFAADVAPIVYSHCSSCHRPGQAAPFSLLSYDDVRRRATLILAATGRRYMPPWHATPGAGFPEFRDSRRLSDSEIATLKAWAAAGMPAGDLSAAPKPPVFPEGWALGSPDIEVAYPEPIEVPADGPDIYRTIVLPVDRDEDAWVTAVDFAPGVRAVVHHALFFAAPAMSAQRSGGDSLLGLRTGGLPSLGGWVPGMTPRFFPDGIAQPLPAHTNLVIQLHLHPSGKVEHELGKMAIYLTKQPPAKRLNSLQVPPMFGFAKGIDIPAAEKRYTVKDSFVLPVDVEAFGARGHAHYLAREMKMTAALPDGTTRGLLWIGDWDFGWQDSYFYKAPFTLPRGTRIDTEIVYDNSDANPRNPNAPPKRVKWGLGTLDEMGSMTLLVVASSRADDAELRRAETRYFRQQLATMFAPK